MSLVRNGSNRVTVYPNEIAYETDILRTNMYKMSDIAFLAQTIIGNGFSLATAFGGLPCTPTSPASLNVQVGSGAMYSLQEYESTNWSSIPADTTDMLYKQAVNLSVINTSSGTLFPGGPITAPVSSGTSVYWIIEAQFATQDLNNTNRPYYDPSNPTVPQYNSYTDTRQDYISFRLKQGTPYSGTSPDVTQIPTPDAGYNGLYAIFVTYGQTTITSGNIIPYPNANFINIPVTNTGVPAGTIIDFAGTSAPTGYLVCDGSVVSQTTYANLYAAIGGTWNTGGEGSGNFRLPSMARRNKVGSGGTATSPAFTGTTVGSYGGEEVHTMTQAELVSHAHIIGSIKAGASGPTIDTSANYGSGDPYNTSNTGNTTAFNEMPLGAIVLMCIKY